MIIETERLILRPWTQGDKKPFAAMNADPEVMRFFPSTVGEEQSNAAVDRAIQHQKDYSFCFWAAELKADGQFAGFIGLQHVPDALECAPAVEIGWRLARNTWGQGLAPEGARAALRYGFNVLKLDEIVSLAPKLNKPSLRVMEKIGMTTDAVDDFEHPLLSEDSPLRPCALYRIKR
ncbi:GNAT family N-acetyltransferase [Kordiimonas sp. SCSIO 12603]|uniref:GNAT family N-acetyltransferase n=1 Tax=Kordiimonas sp. SCSIO 12603 TaxID=2829596 RepID=UPI002102B06A|nr:GNAT family N-acetyltransferase [Kordiimonas sp. SCSIO 12603]UTW57017.1 GNAT family N-acetyltransferase [Kordiimonas sp. SCSIO 12603]